jgi:Ca2+-binding RTX toxin-like protein
MAAKLSKAAASGSGNANAAPDKDAGSGTTDKSAGDVLNGKSGNDSLSGKSGSDTLDGKAGADKLYGNAGADKLYGGNGADYLAGGKGNDLLQGGLGKDVLIGGGGADDFVFKSVAEAGKGGARDVIRDFSRAQGDDIDLSGIDASTKAAGNQGFSFIGSKGFSGKAAELQYKNGIVSGDVNGDKAADFHIEIANHHGLVGGDFIL